MENLPDSAPNPREYDFKRAAWIAEEYSKGDRLLHIHECHPDLCPAPLYVRRWRGDHPEFDLLMIEAEQARAEHLAEEVLSTGDDQTQAAAHNRNRMDARKYMAGALDPVRYGKQQRISVEHSGSVDVRHMATLKDAQLEAIAREGVVMVQPGQVLDGQAERIETDERARIAPPHPPACDAESHVVMPYPDPSESSDIPAEHSVTINNDEEPSDPHIRKVIGELF